MEVAQTKNKYSFEEVMIIEKKFSEAIFGILLLYMLFFVMSWIIPNSLFLSVLGTPALKEPS